MIDAKAFGEELAGIVKAATAPLIGRIEALEKALKDLPDPVSGRDGKDGADGRDGEPGEKGDPGEKGEPGRDGLDVKDLLRAEDGRLVAVMSDGTTKDLGRFVGCDGKDGAPGRDGLGFEDLDFSEDADGRPVATFARDGVTKSVTLPCIVDRGPYRSGQSYLKGDAVSYGGSLWIAQEETGEKPDGGKGWRLAVKKGRDARDQRAKVKDA